MGTDQERLATLESNAAHIKDTLEEVRDDVKAIKAKQAQQAGFLAGMLFILTPLWGAVLVFFKSMWDRFSEQP